MLEFITGSTKGNVEHYSHASAGFFAGVSLFFAKKWFFESYQKEKIFLDIHPNQDQSRKEESYEIIFLRQNHSDLELTGLNHSDSESE